MTARPLTQLSQHYDHRRLQKEEVIREHTSCVRPRHLSTQPTAFTRRASPSYCIRQCNIDGGDAERYVCVRLTFAHTLTYIYEDT